MVGGGCVKSPRNLSLWEMQATVLKSERSQIHKPNAWIDFFLLYLCKDFFTLHSYTFLATNEIFF